MKRILIFCAVAAIVFAAFGMTSAAEPAPCESVSTAPVYEPSPCEPVSDVAPCAPVDVAPPQIVCDGGSCRVLAGTTQSVRVRTRFVGSTCERDCGRRCCCLAKLLGRCKARTRTRIQTSIESGGYGYATATAAGCASGSCGR